MKNSNNKMILEGEVIEPDKSTRTDNLRNVKRSKSSKPSYRMGKFAKYYMEGNTMGNGKASAIKAGYSEKSAESQASQMLKHPKVLAILNSNVERAEQTIIDIMNDGDSEAVRLAAARELMDRTIGKPIQRSITAHVDITVEDMLSSN